MAKSTSGTKGEDHNTVTILSSCKPLLEKELWRMKMVHKSWIPPPYSKMFFIHFLSISYIKIKFKFLISMVFQKKQNAST